MELGTTFQVLDVRHTNFIKTANAASMVLLPHLCSSKSMFIGLSKLSMRSELLEAGRHRTSRLNMYIVHMVRKCWSMLELSLLLLHC